ncbi:MAG: hypothetical protein H8F28_18845 [Fibrella sp.]|nr:hypothetical protein [Armatimonadota bacterium]
MNGLLWIILIGATAMGIAYVAFIPLFWFIKESHKVSMLDMRGEYEEAYRINQKLYRLATIPIIGRIFGNQSVMLLSLSRYSEKMGDFDAAMEYAHTGMLNPSTPLRMAAMQQVASLLRQQGKREEADVLEERAIAAVPTPDKSHSVGRGFASEMASTLSTRAALMMNKGHFAEALAALDRSAQVSDPTHRDLTLSHRAQTLRLMGRYDEAIALQKPVPESFKQFRDQLRSPDPATGTLRKELNKSLQVAEVAALLFSVQICLEAGRTGAASEYYEQLPVSAPMDIAPCCYAVGAWLNAAQGKETEARSRIAQTLAELPASSFDTEVNRYLANAYFALHDYSKAADVWRELIAGSPELSLSQSEFRARLAASYARMEQFDLASAEYEGVIAAGFEEAAFTHEARTQLARLRANDATDSEPVRLSANSR